MKTEEQQANADEIIEEATDELGERNSQEKQDDDWSPDDLSPEQRQQYDRAVKAIDEFVANHPTYKPTDENRQTILDYLADHDLLISPASLELCWEQLQDRLDLADQGDSEQPDATARLATAGLARATKRVESEDSDQSQDLPAPPQKKPTAWRNGKEIEVGS